MLHVLDIAILTGVSLLRCVMCKTTFKDNPNCKTRSYRADRVDFKSYSRSSDRNILFDKLMDDLHTGCKYEDKIFVLGLVMKKLREDNRK